MTREEMGRQAWEHRIPMMRLAVSMLRSSQDAEDAVGDAVVKAMDSADRIKEPARIKAWLLTITANCCRDIMRRRKRVQLTDDDSVFDRPVFEPLKENSLMELLCDLPAAQAQVLTLYYYEGMRSAEIARVLGMPISTVLMRMKRGRERLKTLYETEGASAK